MKLSECERCGAEFAITIDGNGAGRPKLRLCAKCIKEMLNVHDEKLQTLVARNAQLQFTLMLAQDAIENVLRETDAPTNRRPTSPMA